MLKHKPYVCPPGCDKDCCQFCQGGLFYCSVCGAFEGAITQHCPGIKVDAEVWDKVYAGERDYVNDQWIDGNGKMPCHTHKIEIEKSETPPAPQTSRGVCLRSEALIAARMADKLRIADLERQVQQLAAAFLDERDDCEAAVRTIVAMKNGECVEV